MEQQATQTQTKSFPELKNDLILRVIKGEVVDVPPVWVMRQAGRYLPEFQEMRKKYDFFTMVRTPEIAAEITLQPIRRYKMDAAIIFSDILILCQALGMNVEMVPGRGPVFLNPLQGPDDIPRLNFNFDPNIEFKYLIESISLTRKQLDGCCPLIGFAGAPWTLMAYMTNTSSVEGAGSRLYTEPRKWLYLYSKKSEEMLMSLSEAIVKLLLCQYEAGAQLLMLFESHAEVLNQDLFAKFSLPFLNYIANEVKKVAHDVPLIVFAKGAHYAVQDLLKTEFDVVGLDWTITPDEHIKDLCNKRNKVLMGNLDPASLFSDKVDLVKETEKMLNKFKGVRHIANLGHGIYPSTNHENLGAFVDKIRTIKYN